MFLGIVFQSYLSYSSFKIPLLVFASKLMLAPHYVIFYLIYPIIPIINITETKIVSLNGFFKRIQISNIKSQKGSLRLVVDVTDFKVAATVFPTKP